MIACAWLAVGVAVIALGVGLVCGFCLCAWVVAED